MPLELVSEVAIAVMVFGGLAFGDRIASIVASIDSDPDLDAAE